MKFRENRASVNLSVVYVKNTPPPPGGGAERPRFAGHLGSSQDRPGRLRFANEVSSAQPDRENLRRSLPEGFDKAFLGGEDVANDAVR